MTHMFCFSFLIYTLLSHQRAFLHTHPSECCWCNTLISICSAINQSWAFLRVSGDSNIWGRCRFMTAWVSSILWFFFHSFIYFYHISLLVLFISYRNRSIPLLIQRCIMFLFLEEPPSFFLSAALVCCSGSYEEVLTLCLLVDSYLLLLSSSTVHLHTLPQSCQSCLELFTA